LSEDENYQPTYSKSFNYKRNNTRKSGSCDPLFREKRKVRFADFTCGKEHDEAQQHRCYVCQEQFLSRNDLQQHLCQKCYPLEMREQIEKLTQHIEDIKPQQQLYNGKPLDYDDTLIGVHAQNEPSNEIGIISDDDIEQNRPVNQHSHQRQPLTRNQRKNRKKREKRYQFEIIRLDDWRRCFTRTKSEGKYIELNENNEHDEKDEPVDILRLFQFANTFDWIMMCTAMFFIIIHAGCILANLFLYGQLTGLFAIDSYASNCNNSNQNATASIHRKNAVLQGIELQAFGNAQSHKLRNDSGIIASSGLSRSQFVFRDNVMALVYWLFIIGAVEFLVSSIESFLWNWTIKRQTYRMSVSLFKSLAQRRIPYLDSNQATQLNAKLFDNIAKIEKGIGIELLILIATITGIFGCLIMSFAVNWKLTMIMLFLIPLVIGSSLVFSKLTANETVYELKTYAKAGQIVQEAFSSL
ncbi:unnamed protein product, partial [Rotaria socialis]